MNISMFHLALVHYHRLQLDKRKNKKQFTLSIFICMSMYKTTMQRSPMIISRSFDYDNIISRRACSYTTNSIIIIITNEVLYVYICSLVKTRSLFSQFFFLSQCTIDRFSFFLHPYRVSLHSNFLTCRLELTALYISLLMFSVHRADK